MPAPLPPSLVELRNSVAVRARLARNGALLAAHQPMIDETLRRAQRDIYLRFPWAIANVRRSTSLVGEQAIVDLPSDIHPGQIHYLAVISADDAADSSRTPREHPIEMEMLAARTATWREAGKPRYARIINQELHLYPPALAAEWPLLILEGRTRESPLVNEADRCAVDGEALIELATIMVCEDLELRDVRQRRGDWLTSINKLRNLDRPGQAYAIASERYAGPLHGHMGEAGLNAAYTTSWSPW